MRPLAGVTVVALEQAVAAPFATRQLADLGARVIKIERPGSGDFARAYDTSVNGLSANFAWLNRAKESLTLDVKRPEGRDVLDRLLAGADVFIHNLAPGAVDRLGFDRASLRGRFPRLIVGQISGYGTTGPDAQRRAYDLIVQGETGLLSITGSKDAPAKVAISVADIAAGMYVYSGVLTALLTRASTGEGTTFEVSLFDALAEWMGLPLYYATYGGTEPPRSGSHHALIAPYGPYAAGDGKAIYLAIQNEREWTRFCTTVLEAPELIVDPRFATNADRVANRNVLDALLLPRLARLSSEALTSRLDAAAIANGRTNTMREFALHPQLVERGRWQIVDSPVGPIRALAPPTIMEGVEPVMGPLPAIGEHTDRILAELGIEAGTVTAWRAAGII